MNDALVDSEGYPRADIDVYQVRHARHKIICEYLTSKCFMFFTLLNNNSSVSFMFKGM